ncbi:RNase adapter RapZ [Tessaracoccus sp. OH4464_COT-324]|uniref:RNase adapter RapZ n=1 Tax=Tessaracoccus sp. OH4464_COT-324 TaxID=2491059 RepID=UPI000F643AA3|nr:RNase adapter RapZ [Tessaracoccus sp. OH4464_COT-324]RRD47701.1 RNase adapter RapZ [Tessaracoccus sp. OH4464_COT-324]
MVKEIAIITGLSGAGRRTAAHAMEDLGWYVVDNLPPVMLPSLAKTVSGFGVDRLAVVADVRTRVFFEQFPAAIEQLRAQCQILALVYLEADDDVIVQRQESNRRPLPLQGAGRLMDGIAKERHLLSELRARADIVIDTSRLSARQLVQRVSNHFGSDSTDNLSAAIMSFGFKHGLPIDADLVFDVRFLPNPFWIPELRPKSGLSRDVAQYVLKHHSAQELLGHIVSVVDTTAPGYLAEGKRQVTIAVGCTGGKHRSTAISEELGRRLAERGYGQTVMHRDIEKE